MCSSDLNSSGFSDPSQPFSGPNDAYLYSQDGSLTIGTNTTGKNLIFHTGGFVATNERMRIIDNATQKDSLISLSSHLRWLNDTTANRPTTPLAGTVRYNTTQAKFEGYENGSWQNFMPYDYRTTTTQASTSTTYANITQLQSVSLPVGNYKFKAVIKFQTAATTTGIGLRFSNNSATVSQTNGGNNANITLINAGSPASVNLTQTGGQSYGITQTCYTAACGTITLRQGN